MKSLNELHEIYKKAIDATLFENGNFDAYTPKQQEELTKLNESIERLAEKDLDTEVYLNKVNGWIDCTAFGFAKNVWHILVNYDREDMDHSFNDGSHQKGKYDFYDVLIPTKEYAVFEYAGLTEYADWNQRV